MRLSCLACLMAGGLVLAAHGKEDASPGDILWEIAVDGRALASAAFDEESVYFGTAGGSASDPEGQLLSVDRDTGEIRWTKSFTKWLMASPVVTSTRIFIGCDDTNLYCLDKANGEELWRFDTAGRIDSTPCVDTLGNSYVGSRDRFFYALNPDGELLWSQFLTGGVASSPILNEREQRIYVADLANTIYAFDLSGQRLWSYKPRQGGVLGVRLRIYSSPTLDNEHLLYVGSGDHFIYAIDRTSGRLFWREDTGGIVDSSPVISADEFLYVANREGILRKYYIDLFRAQREVWASEEVGQVFYGSPTIDQERNLYLCGAPPLGEEEEDPMTQLSYIDHEEGGILWKKTFPGYTDATPLLDREGNLYFGTAAGSFYKVRGAGSPLADSNWPTFRGQPLGHGRYEMTYSQWLGDFGIPAEFAQLERDTDGDRVMDYLEFVGGTNPQDPQSYPVEFLEVSSPTQLNFQLQKGIRAPYQLQTSDDVQGWENLPLGPGQLLFEDLGTVWDVKATVPPEKNFYRLRWARP